MGRAREALRPCGLFVSLGSFRLGLGGRIFAFCVQIPAMGLATVFNSSIVRSLAHLPEGLHWSRCIFDAALTKHA